jgi:hypothetical protein
MSLGIGPTEVPANVADPAIKIAAAADMVSVGNAGLAQTPTHSLSAQKPQSKLAGDLPRRISAPQCRGRTSNNRETGQEMTGAVF